MDKLNFLLMFATGLVPLVIGFVWYNPKVFGTAWMHATGMTEEKAKGANMPLIFGLTYVFGVMISLAMYPMVIHQMGIFSTLEEGLSAKDPVVTALFEDIMSKHGQNFRTFKHGALHGLLSGVFIALPLISITALFERRNFKYIAIHAGYFIVVLAIIGGIICQWA